MQWHKRKPNLHRFLRSACTICLRSAWQYTSSIRSAMQRHKGITAEVAEGCLHVETAAIASTPKCWRPGRSETLAVVTSYVERSGYRGGTIVEADQDEIFREIYLQKLPLTILITLAIHEDKTLIALAKMDDMMGQPAHSPYGQIDHLPQGNTDIATINSEIQKL